MPVYALEKVGVCVLSVEVYQVTLSVPPSPLASIGTVGVRGIVVIIVGTELCVVMIVETVSCVSNKTTIRLQSWQLQRHSGTRGPWTISLNGTTILVSQVGLSTFLLLRVNSNGPKFSYEYRNRDFLVICKSTHC